jgi:hypothetical protein
MAKILETQDVIAVDLQSTKTIIRESHTLDSIEDEDGPVERVSFSNVYTLAIVRPTTVPKRERHEIPVLVQATPEDLRLHLDRVLNDTDLVALDIETRGHNPLADSAAIVGFSLTTQHGTVYIHTLDFAPTDPRWELMFSYLLRPELEFIGHNVMFDGSWMYVWMGSRWLNWKFDTYAIYRQLASEGYPIQLGGAYALKQAQLDLLGWKTKGNDELNAWLVSNGYTTTPGGDKADKSQMWRAPSDVVGYYCGLDTYSTYHLLVSVFFPSVEPYTWAASFGEYHATFHVNLRLLIVAYLDGIKIDLKKMEAYRQELEIKTTQAKSTFMTHPDIAPHIESYRQDRLIAYAKTAPAQFKVGPKLGAEPAKFKKNGEVSTNWQKWNEKREKIESGEFREVSATWTAWAARMDKLTKDELFNLDSGPMRKWLFYDKMKFPVKTTTDKGNPETGKKALSQWGEYGRMLKVYNDLNKEGQMVRSCMAATFNSRIHPQFKAPGTFTGRLAGGSQSAGEDEAKFNIQQIPKKRGYLECWIPDDGFIFVDVDHSAIEPTIMTALSRDPSLLKIYGPNAPKHQDIYLFVGSQLPGIGEKLRSLGYDPDNPTKEAIDATKKAFKKERQIAKVIQLGSQYGMGPKKLRLTLELEGVLISEDEALQLWTSYWKIFSGVKEYGRELEWEWKRNGGFVINAVGRPICCASDLVKDLGNRCLTGDTLVLTENRGYVRLDMISNEDRVWDGIEWVSHRGLINQGIKSVISVQGVRLTPDHKILTTNGMQEAQHVKEGLHTIQAVAYPKRTWKDVWRLSSYIFKQVAQKLKNIR